MNVTPRASPIITYNMRGAFQIFLFAVFLCALLPACSRERSRTVSEEEAEAALEGPRDYREMLARARSKQNAAQNLEDMENAIHRFQFELARLPTNLLELKVRGFLPTIPEPPRGQAYSYDPVHGNVKLLDIPDGSGIQLPPESTNLTPVRLQDVMLPTMP